MNFEDLKKEQIKLAKKITVKDDFEDIKLIAGCDQVFFNTKDVLCAFYQRNILFLFQHVWKFRLQSLQNN